MKKKFETPKDVLEAIRDRIVSPNEGVTLLKKLHLGKNGKAPDETPEAVPEINRALEKKLLAICRKMLRVSTDEFNSHSDFFDFGFDSIMVMDLISRIAKETGRSLSPEEIVDNPNVLKLAAVLKTEHNAY